MRTLAVLLALAGAFAADVRDPAYVKSIEQWRADHERDLKSDEGWLNVAGLFWLKEGANRAGTDARTTGLELPDGPAFAGVFTLRGRTVTYRGASDAADRTLRPNSDVVRIGRLKLFVIVRGEKIGLRMRDPGSRMLREFQGEHWYPIQEDARIVADFVAAPRKIRVPNILGQNNDEDSPGYAVFRWKGREWKLFPVREPKRLFFIFRDRTSAHGTYGAGRFLYADFAKDGKVVLDFNKAENPPCAFTPYATCPLPPRENRLDVKIEAGELDYAHR